MIASSTRVPMSDVGHRVEPQRHRRYAADAERDPAADAVVVERDLRRRRGEGEVAPAGVDLVEADADARLAPDRKAHRREAAGRRQRRHHRPDEEIGSRKSRAVVPPSR